MIKAFYNKEFVYPQGTNYYFSHTIIKSKKYINESELVDGKYYYLELNDAFGNIISGLIEHKFLGIKKDNLLHFEEIDNGDIKRISKDSRAYRYYKEDFDMDNSRTDYFTIDDEKFGLRVHSNGEINAERYL